ncbi:hypothetical protein [Staphylococcus epidermidis]|uniref:hypothetical protein n=1 Tax=Staphylococcus epidermidis TaxID=1282 RepID=UPI00301B2A97
MNAEAKFVSSVMDARLKKAKRERDSFRKQRDELINDMAETKKKAKAFDLISNSYTTEIKQALKNKELNQCLFLLEQILDDLEANNER